MATYTVKQGDSLLKIAQKYNLTASSLLSANPGVKSVGPGITLRVPNLEGFGGPNDPLPPTYQPPAPTQNPYGRKPPPTRPPGPIAPTPAPPPNTYGRRPPPTQPQPPHTPGQYNYTPPRTAPPAARYTPPLRSYQYTQPDRTVPRADLTQYNEARRQAPPARQVPFTGQGAGLIPGTFGSQPAEQFGQTVAPIVGNRIQGFLDRLFRKSPPLRIQDPSRRFLPEPSAPYRPGQPLVAYTGDTGRPTPQTPLVDYTGNTGRSPYVSDPTLTSSLGEREQARAAALRSGLDIEQGVIGPDGWPVFEGTEHMYPGYPAERSSILDWYLDQGRLPVILFREDIALKGWTDAELLAYGYVKDQFGDWILGGSEPGAPQQAGGGGGGGGGYYGGGGGGGGGYGGGGSYSYPSRLPFEQDPYPQSFVQQGQRGQSPTGRSTRPARMGAVNWRI